MRKNFGKKTWFYPLPVLIIGSYDEEGRPVEFQLKEAEQIETSGDNVFIL